MFENIEFTRPIQPDSDDHDLMTIADFTATVEWGGINDHDGVGDLVQFRDGRYFRSQTRDGQISPSQWAVIPPTATHVAWYNK